MDKEKKFYEIFLSTESNLCRRKYQIDIAKY